MLYDKIKKCAKERNISITNLEIKLGLGNGTIGKWKTKMPSTTNLQKLADFFGKPIEYFLQVGDSYSRNNGNVLQNSINESDNAVLVINDRKDNFSKQEKEIIAIYRSLELEKQAEFILFLSKLKK